MLKLFVILYFIVCFYSTPFFIKIIFYNGKIEYTLKLNIETRKKYLSKYELSVSILIPLYFLIVITVFLLKKYGDIGQLYAIIFGGFPAYLMFSMLQWKIININYNENYKSEKKVVSGQKINQ